MTNAFTEDRLQGLAIQYACRTTPVDDLKAPMRKEILSKLKGIWPDHFEREVPADDPGFHQLALGNPGLLYAANRTLFLGGAMAQVPTLLVAPNTITVAVPRMLAGQDLGIYKGDRWLKEDRVNTRARQVILALQDTLGVTAHRAGKIVEMIFDPIAPEELTVLVERVFGSLGEKPRNVQASLTFVRECRGQAYNFVLNLVATPQNLENPCQVLVKVDVNNRDMTRSLDPRDISRVHEAFDKEMPDWVMGVLGGNS